ncbi:MAG: alpha/beta fold hydrolase [Opitutaceae bacterium]|jgi:pimeloyl-ACP methyl ester carboxylesterase
MFAALFVVPTVGLRAGEAPVEVAPGLSGAWVTPDSRWDGKAVVLMHGLADDMNGAGNLMKRLAADLASRGIASLRINFRGEGDRSRTKIDSTFATRLEDAAAAQAFMIKQPGVRPGHSGLMGWSLGAATAIETAARDPGSCRSLVVWSSPGGELYAGLAGQPPLDKAAAQAAATGFGNAEIPGWKTITLSRAFFESFRGHNVDWSLTRYPGAFLSVRGSKDFLSQHDVEFLRAASGRPAEAVLIGGADHVFSVFEPNLGHDTRAVEVTVQWFLRTL